MKSFLFSHFSLHLSGIMSITFARVALGKPGTSELDANTKHHSNLGYGKTQQC